MSNRSLAVSLIRNGGENLRPCEKVLMDDEQKQCQRPSEYRTVDVLNTVEKGVRGKGTNKQGGWFYHLYLNFLITPNQEPHHSSFQLEPKAGLEVASSWFRLAPVSVVSSLYPPTQEKPHSTSSAVLVSFSRQLAGPASSRRTRTAGEQPLLAHIKWYDKEGGEYRTRVEKKRSPYPPPSTLPRTPDWSRGTIGKVQHARAKGSHPFRHCKNHP